MHISAESTAAATKKRGKINLTRQIISWNCFVLFEALPFLLCVLFPCFFIISVEISSRTHDLERNELDGTMEMGFQWEKKLKIT